MTDIKAKIPFELLERCKAQHEWKEDTDEYYKYNHYENCVCHGSNMVPSMVGYEVLDLVRWVLKYSHWRLSNYRADSLMGTLNYVNKETERLKAASDKLLGRT